MVWCGGHIMTIKLIVRSLNPKLNNMRKLINKVWYYLKWVLVGVLLYVVIKIVVN